jgi:hypothetical protein
VLKTEKLLKGIKDLSELEKGALPLLNRHITSAIAFSGIKEGERSGIVNNFQRMAVAVNRHIEMLGDIEKDIQNRKQDVY